MTNMRMSRLANMNAKIEYTGYMPAIPVKIRIIGYE
jgi:hypothetical protein